MTARPNRVHRNDLSQPNDLERPTMDSDDGLARQVFGIHLAAACDLARKSNVRHAFGRACRTGAREPRLVESRLKTEVNLHHITAVRFLLGYQPRSSHDVVRM